MAENTPNNNCSIKKNHATINSQELFGNGREITIQHKGTAYKLTITRFDKLILTK